VIQTFANQLTNLDAGLFIPEGIWDINMFASALTLDDTTHIRLFFRVFGISALGIETQIGTDSSLVSVNDTTIEKLFLTNVMPYTNLTPYVSLVIKLYGINDRVGVTNIVTYYQSGETYSHLHTTLGISPPNSILPLNNVWTGTNTFELNTNFPTSITSQSTIDPLLIATVSPSLISVVQNAPAFGDPTYTNITPANISMIDPNYNTSSMSINGINITSSTTGNVFNATSSEITIDDTLAGKQVLLNPTHLTLTDWSIDSGSGNMNVSSSGSVIFNTIPTCGVIPTQPNDLVNLNYLQNNPPASAVIFYLNNSQTPSPAISTYRLLGAFEDGLTQSSINTSISGVGTIQLVQTFANQLTNLNAGSFIPAGIWDVNIFASSDNGGSTTHINLYFAVFGRTSLGVETQIGTNSSLVSVDSTTVEQLKMTLALPYTDITSYNSLVIKIYGVCNRATLTSITTFYEGTTTYSHVHTTFGVYVPPSLLSLNNTWTGVNTFTQIINSIGLSSLTSLSLSSSILTTISGNLLLNNETVTTSLSVLAGVLNIDLANKQVNNFNLSLSSSINTITISNGVQNGRYTVYMNSVGVNVLAKHFGYANNLAGNLSMVNGSLFTMHIYFNGSTYYFNIINYTN